MRKFLRNADAKEREKSSRLIWQGKWFGYEDVTGLKVRADGKGATWAVEICLGIL